MIALHHQIAAPARPYDYRVAYFQRTSSGTDTARFLLPSVKQLNPAMDGSTYNDERTRALLAADWTYSVTGGFAPGSATGGDRKLFGTPGWIAFDVLNGLWRPGGVMTWPPQIPAAAIPLTAGIAIKIDFVPSGYTARSSAGHEHVQTYAHNPVQPDNDLSVLYGEGNVTSGVAVGGRFFGCALRNDHPTYGFDADYICVMKDGEPYVYDRVSGAFYPNIGGAQYAAGPKVADSWEPLDWEEPA